jgi:Zn2+/Cd2+-exporting ATPase
VINQNLGFGILFIILGMSLSKFLPPVMAAVLHFASSIVVVFNSARLVRFGEHLDHKAGDKVPGTLD